MKLPAWDQGFFHITKAHKYRRMTLIMRKGLPLRENYLALSHHCRGLMYSSPKCITLDAAAIRPNSLWNCLTVSDWPSLILFTADRMDSILCSGESTLFLAFSRNPNYFLWARTTSRCQTANWFDWARINQFNMRIPWRRRGTRDASMHFVEMRRDNARPSGRTQYW